MSKTSVDCRKNQKKKASVDVDVYVLMLLYLMGNAGCASAVGTNMSARLRAGDTGVAEFRAMLSQRIALRPTAATGKTGRSATYWLQLRRLRLAYA